MTIKKVRPQESTTPHRHPLQRPPDRDPSVLHQLANVWHSDFYENTNAQSAIPELPFRLSDVASRCDRQLVYRLRATPTTNPMSIADIWRVNLGTMVHSIVEDVMPVLYPDGASEVVVDLRDISVPGSGRLDYVDPESSTVFELKTVGGFKFKKSATTFGGPPEGVPIEHILQPALGAFALGCDNVTIIYLALENLSVSMAKDFANVELARFGAQWTFTRDEWLPLVEDEIARLQRLSKFINPAHGLPARELHTFDEPIGAIITAPKAASAPWNLTIDGAVVDAGTTWRCGYCSHFEQCVTDGASSWEQPDLF